MTLFGMFLVLFTPSSPRDVIALYDCRVPHLRVIVLSAYEFRKYSSHRNYIRIVIARDHDMNHVKT